MQDMNRGAYLLRLISISIREGERWAGSLSTNDIHNRLRMYHLHVLTQCQHRTQKDGNSLGRGHPCWDHLEQE